MTADDDSSLDLKEIGSYRIVRKLGSGGMGAVYLAEDDGTRVALKLMHPHLFERKGFLRRFQREARAGTRVEHPNVVRTLGFDMLMEGDTPRCFLVMEYVEGRSLREAVQELEVLPEALVRVLGAQIAAGLAAIHGAGIVHRDLKPDNVLVTPDHQVRIMDLGIAKAEDASTDLTKDNFVGTVQYAAPEQIAGGEITPATDLYALGVVLYELATGSNPFRHSEAKAVMHAHLQRVPLRAQELSPDVSTFLSEVVATLLEKDPDQRLASAGALAHILAHGERSAWWAEREREVRARQDRLPRIGVGRETGLIGRDADRAAISDLWKEARAGSARTLLLGGEAGIGKTRLVDAFLQDLTVGDCTVLYGSFPPDGDRNAVFEALIAHVGGADLVEALRPYLPDTPSLVPALAALLRPEEPLGTVSALHGDASGETLAQVLRRLARERPVVWIVEDLHFADLHAQRLVASLVRSASDLPVLFVLTTRPGFNAKGPAHLDRIPGLASRALERLGPEDVERLLRERLGREDLAAQLAPLIVDRSGGIPLFALEMVRGLEHGGAIREQDDGTYRATGAIERIEVPAAVEGLVAMQLVGVGPEERAVLDMAAVVGFEFDAGLVARALSRPLVAVLQDLAALERRRGLVRGVGEGYRFDHRPLQQVLYDEMPHALRAACHVAVAEAVEARESEVRPGSEALDGTRVVGVCRHYLEGGRKTKVRTYVDRALAHLRETNRHDAWIALARRVLADETLVAGAKRADLLLDLASELAYVGRPADDVEPEEEAVTLADRHGDPALRARAHGALGQRYLTVGRDDDGVRELNAAIRLAGAAGSTALEARLHANLGAGFRRLGRLEEARASTEQAVLLLRRAEDRAGEAAALLNLGSLELGLGRHREARAAFERGLALSRETGDRRALSQALWKLARLSAALGEADPACRYAAESLEHVRAIGYARGEAEAAAFLGGQLSDLGRFEEALGHLRRALGLAGRLGDPSLDRGVRRRLAETYLSLGRLDEARPHLDRLLELGRAAGRPALEADARALRGRLAWERGDVSTARSELDRSVALAREAGKRWSLAHALLLRAPLQVEAGETSSALASLGEALEAARAVRSRGLSLRIAALRAALDPASSDVAYDLLARVGERVARSDEMEARFHLWRATGDRAHLEAAHRLLGELGEEVRLRREIDQAAREGRPR